MDNLADQHSVFGRDMTQVFCSHVVFVDARDRRGLGVGAEMMWAKMNKIPVVTWAPKDSHYNKTNLQSNGNDTGSYHVIVGDRQGRENSRIMETDVLQKDRI